MPPWSCSATTTGATTSVAWPSCAAWRAGVVLFTWEPASSRDTWVVRDYFPCFDELIPDGYRLSRTVERLGGGRVEAVPIPHDCLDGFYHAYWRRPEAYLDPAVRAGISAFALMDQTCVEAGLAQAGSGPGVGSVGPPQRGSTRARRAGLRLRLVVHESGSSAASPRP